MIRYEETETSITAHLMSVVGTFLKATIPDDLHLFRKNGVCIDRRSGIPMEMDAYSLYLGLKALERHSGRSREGDRELLVGAVLERLAACDGFFSHGMWTGSDKEVHLRFSAAAIRLLLEAHSDGLNVTHDQVFSTLRHHLEYSEKISDGLWFLHDSLECQKLQSSYHVSSRNRSFGSSASNCMVLNTHVDTLVTILHVLRRLDLQTSERTLLNNYLQSGITTLRSVITSRSSVPRQIFCHIDALARRLLFNSFKLPNRTTKSKMGIVSRKYFAARRRILAVVPGFLFPDGYIERDLSLSGKDFEYHLVNAYDLSRFVAEADRSEHVKDNEFIDLCDRIIDSALDYCIKTSYWDYLLAAALESSRPILLCEIIATRLRKRNGDIPKHWQFAYCSIRRILPRSPALMGCDPVILAPQPRSTLTPGCDVVSIDEVTDVCIDLALDRFVIKNIPPAREVQES